KNFIKSLIGDVHSLKILDAGCGNGEYSAMLREKEVDVIGCDGSAGMLKIAKAAYPLCTFDEVDLLAILPYKDNQFDMVLCNLTLMDLDPIQGTVSEIFRVLKPGGRFLFSIIHPAFYISDWEKDEQGIAISKKVTGYITPRVEKQDFWGTTTHYHRPLSYYFNTLADCGFRLKKMYEPSVYEKEKLPDIPLYLFAEFQKPTDTKPDGANWLAYNA
ncbi:MAG: class I SAM-dependent methyltransferase, partial [Oscillospiraceae bacterium]|nr:class I SAM-dependent methyltransferase [Oscillospiraceae bacterium]